MGNLLSCVRNETARPHRISTFPSGVDSSPSLSVQATTTLSSAPSGLRNSSFESIADGTPQTTARDSDVHPHRQEPSTAAALMESCPASVGSCQELDLLVSALCHIFDAPYVSLVLYYHDSCWLVNVKGSPAGFVPGKAMSNLPHTVVCEDVLQEVQSEAHHLLWEQHGLRSYCCAPLLASSGHRLGSVCFMDTEPRRIDAGMCRVLNNFGELAVRTLERHIELVTSIRAAHLPLPSSLQILADVAHARIPIHTYLVHVSGTDHILPDDVSGGGQESTDLCISLGAPVAPKAAQNTIALPSSPLSPSSIPHKQMTDSSCPANVLLANLASRRTRQPSAAHGACCLIVDAGAPGWPVLYADETWKMWSGFSRSSLLERGLQGLLAPASPGVCPMNWDMLQRQADAGERFIIPGVVAVLQGRLGRASSTWFGRHGRPASTHRRASMQPTRSGSDTLDDPALTLDTMYTPQASNSVQHSIDAAADNGFAPLQTCSTLASGVGTHMAVLDNAWTSHAEDLLQLLAITRQVDVSGGRVRVTGPGNSAVQLAQDSSADITRHRQGPRATFLPTADATRGTGISGTSSCWPALQNGGQHLNSSLQGVGRALDLTFRPMALDVLDEDTLPMGIPSTVPMEACASVKKLYVVWLHMAASTAMPTQPLAPALKASQRPSTIQQVAGQLFPGLAMAQVLGKGGYGTAHLGHWHDVDVVVKVQDHYLPDPLALRTAQVEVAVGQLLRHPYLVRTIAHGAVELDDDSSRLTHQNSGLVSPEEASIIRGGTTVHPTAYEPFPVWTWDNESVEDSFSCAIIDGAVKFRSSLVGGTIDTLKDLDDFLPPPAAFVNAASVDATISALSKCNKEQTPLLRKITHHTDGAFSTPLNIENNDAVCTSSGVASFVARHTYVNLSSEQVSNGAAASVPPEGSLMHFLDPQVRAMSPDLVAANTLETSPPIVYHPLTPSPAPASNSPGPMLRVSAPSIPNAQSTSSGPCRLISATASGKTRTASNHTPRSYSTTHVNVSASALGRKPAVSASVTSEMAMMMASTEVHDMMMGAKPMVFPMQLRTFAVLEYCDGGNLQEAIDRGLLRHGPSHAHADAPHLPRLLALAGHVACAASYLHARGVVHADLTPANVLLCTARPNMPHTSSARLCTASHMSGLTSTISCRTSSGTVPGACMLGRTSDATSWLQHQYKNVDIGSNQMSSTGLRSGYKSEGEVHEVFEPLCAHASKRYWLAPNQESQERMPDEFIAKIADFGTSCLMGRNGVAEAKGYATVSHAAPEVIHDRMLSPAADVYSMGVLLWQMYTGSSPWSGLNSRQILAVVLAGDSELQWPDHLAASLPIVERDVAQELIALGRSCLSRDPAARPEMAFVEARLIDLMNRLQPSAPSTFMG